MIVTIVQFQLSDYFTADKARSVFVDAVPKYVRMNGLIRKYFLLAEDVHSAGTIYLWKDRAAADAFFTDDWVRYMVNKYGSRPTLTFYECPVVVDNHTGEVITELK